MAKKGTKENPYNVEEWNKYRSEREARPPLPQAQSPSPGQVNLTSSGEVMKDLKPGDMQRQNTQITSIQQPLQQQPLQQGPVEPPEGSVNFPPKVSGVPPGARDVSFSPDGSLQYVDITGVNHHLSADGKDTVLQSGAVAPITAEDLFTVMPVGPMARFGSTLGKIGLAESTIIARAETKAMIKLIESNSLASFMSDCVANIGQIPSKSTITSAGKIVSNQLNTATLKMADNILKKNFTSKGLKFFGKWAAYISLGAAAVGFGLWGRAEAPESPTMIMNKYLIPNARRTGNWTLVHEASDAISEITEPSAWDFLYYTPFSPIKGSLEKIKGNAMGAKVLNAVANDLEHQQLNGEDEEAYYQRISDRENADFKNNTDYYNQQRLRYDIIIKASEKAQVDYYNQEAVKTEITKSGIGRSDVDYYNVQSLETNQQKIDMERAWMLEQGEYWRKEKEKTRKQELADQQAIQNFWTEYRIQQQIINENSRPSALTFGLI